MIKPPYSGFASSICSASCRVTLKKHLPTPKRKNKNVTDSHFQTACKELVLLYLFIYVFTEMTVLQLLQRKAVVRRTSLRWKCLTYSGTLGLLSGSSSGGGEEGEAGNKKEGRGGRGGYCKG